MSLTELWNICALKLGTTVIDQIIDQSINQEMQALLAGDSGGPYPRHMTVGQEVPRIRITTQKIKTALATVGLTGLDVTLAAPATLYWQKHTFGGVRTADQCKAQRIDNGMVIWRSLQAEHGQLAQVELEVIGATPDGTAAPYASLTAQTNPTIATTPEMYMITGSDGVVGASIDTGIREHLIQADGCPWPLDVTIDGINPVARLRKLTMGALGAATLASFALNARAAGGYVGATPITFTFNRNMANPRSIAGRPAVTEWEVLTAFDGTNAPIVMTGLT